MIPKWYKHPSYILRASIQIPSAHFSIFVHITKPPQSAILSVCHLFYSLDSFSLFQEIYKHIISRVAVNWNSLLQLGFHLLLSLRLCKVIPVLSLPGKDSKIMDAFSVVIARDACNHQSEKKSSKLCLGLS